VDDDATETCVEKLVTGAGVQQGNLPVPTTSPEPATLAALPDVHPAGDEALVPAAPTTFAPPLGENTRLERPPRPPFEIGFST
jgi:hypothetical protein